MFWFCFENHSILYPQLTVLLDSQGDSVRKSWSPVNLSPVRDEGCVSHPWITPATPAFATAAGKVSALSLCVLLFLKNIFDVVTTTCNTFSMIK